MQHHHELQTLHRTKPLYTSTHPQLLPLLHHLLNPLHRHTLLPHLDPPFLHIRQRRFPHINRLLPIKELCNLLHRRIPRLHNTKVNNANLKREENAVANVVAPLNGVERDAVDELVEEEGGRDAEVEPGEALCAEAVGQDFGGVAGHYAGFDVVEDAVEELVAQYISIVFLLLFSLLTYGWVIFMKG